MEKKKPKEMTGAELASMLKSNIQFKSLGGMRSDDLTLPPEDKDWWRDAKIGMFIHWGYTPSSEGESGPGLMRRFQKRSTRHWPMN